MSKIKEQHFEVINRLNVIIKQGRIEASEACEQITKQEMVKFAEWLQTEEWEATIFTKGTFKKRHQDAPTERKTIEELLELYLKEQP